MFAMQETYQSAQTHGAFSAYMEMGVKSFDLLRKVDDTCLALGTLEDSCKRFKSTVISLTGSLKNANFPIPEDEVVKRLNVVEGLLEDTHKKIRKEFDQVESVPLKRAKLKVHYRHAINAMCDLYDAVQTYRWSVMSHNALLDGSDGGKKRSTDKEIDEFFASL